MENKLLKKRFLAVIIDQFAISLVYSFVNLFVDLDFYVGNLFFLGKIWTVNLSFILLISLIYYLSFDLFNNGITFGKSIIKIKVISINGTNLLVSEKIIRSIIKVISIAILIFPLLYFFITNSIYHDKIVKSKTIKSFF